MSRCLVVLIFTLGLCVSAPAAVVVVPLTFVPATSSYNTLNLTVTAAYMGISDSDSKATTVQSGSTAQLKLDYTFDDVTRVVTSVNSIEFVGGNFTLSDVEFNLSYLFGLVKEKIKGIGIGGTFDTRSPPGSITGGTAATFPTEQHDVILNQGRLEMSGYVARTIYLSSNPIATTTTGTGQINTSAPSIVGGTATYNVEMILPVNFNEPVDTGDPNMVASVKGIGTFKAVGSFVIEPPPNYPPVAVHDPASQYASFYRCDEDAFISVPAAMGVLFNDTDANGDPLTAFKTTNPANGTVELSPDGSFVYTPNPDWFGTDTFKYKAFDGVLWSNEATVSLDVISVNDRPVAVDDYYETPQDTILQMAAHAGVLKNDYDPDNRDHTTLNDQTVTASLLTGVSHGALTLYSAGWFKYTPTPGFSGMDSFTYRAHDGIAYSDPATVLINVIGTTKVPGDANGDGYVNDLDAKILADHWGDAGATWAMGDFDKDGVIGPKDAAILAANWGYAPGSGGEADAAAVPEPSIPALLAAMLLGWATRRRR